MQRFRGRRVGVWVCVPDRERKVSFRSYEQSVCFSAQPPHPPHPLPNSPPTQPLRNVAGKTLSHTLATPVRKYTRWHLVYFWPTHFWVYAHIRLYMCIHRKMHIEPTVAGAESGNVYVLPHLTHENVRKMEKMKNKHTYTMWKVYLPNHGKGIERKKEG